MRRHRHRRSEGEPLLRTWCSDCETYTFVLDGKKACCDPAFAPPEPQRDHEESDLRRIRRCAWPACSRLVPSANGKWCVAHSGLARRRTNAAASRRYRESRQEIMATPASAKSSRENVDFVDCARHEVSDPVSKVGSGVKRVVWSTSR